MKKIKIGILLVMSLICFNCFNNNVYAAGESTFSCTYIGQKSGKALFLSKTTDGSKEKWTVKYPDDTTTTSSDMSGNVLPTSKCDDIFYSAKSGVIKAVTAKGSHSYYYVSEYCSKYSDLEQFCSDGCDISNPPCGNQSELVDYGDCPEEFAHIILFLKKVVMNTLNIFVPIILIVMATVDLVKAVMASDDKKMQESMPKIIRRIGAAVIMFFVTTIVSLTLDMISKTNEAGNESAWKACWQGLK